MSRHPERLGRAFFATDAGALAQQLLGCVLVRTGEGGERLAGRIVETEAYLGPEDAAAHSKGWRRTPRTEPMFCEPGTSYVFLTYGMHHCFNIVCERAGYPAAVLIRALEPTEGVAAMHARRLAGTKRPGRVLRDRDLCSGPAKLCQAMGIDRALNAIDLCVRGDLWVEAGEAPLSVTNTTRIGVDYAGAWASAPLRWYVTASPHVSVRDRARESAGGV
ncbi:MAG: DNA-3-methyladenine glycosylase [Phycisphaerales bacterium]|nr:MAG: DNA-3-methyladenine glycosylase [Phycisphaerales bacterium]